MSTQIGHFPAQICENESSDNRNNTNVQPNGKQFCPPTRICKIRLGLVAHSSAEFRRLSFYLSSPAGGGGERGGGVKVINLQHLWPSMETSQILRTWEEEEGKE